LYKLLTFILLLSYPQISFSTAVTSHAEKIVDSLYMVELSVNGVVNHLKNEWSDVPDVALGLECFESEVSPRLKHFYVEVLDSSIEPQTLKKGSFLTSKAGVINSKEFVLSADFAEEAKSKSFRVDVFTLIMASKQVESSMAKNELLGASDWLKVNGPIFSTNWVSKIEQYQGIIQGALGSCFEME
jgi:hypothetical protein